MGDERVSAVIISNSLTKFNMPKLIYFPVQGRAQAIRYMLASKNVAFEDQRITGAEWGPMKAAKTYGDAQLPIYIRDDGTWLNQSVAILKTLAMEHGYAPADAKALYENEWFYSTLVDTMEKPARYAIMKDDASAEEKQGVIGILDNIMNALEAHFADGREHVAGSAITDADFYLMAIVTSSYENANGKHAEIREAGAAKVQACPNVMRVLAPMRELCAAQISSLEASSI